MLYWGSLYKLFRSDACFLLGCKERDFEGHFCSFGFFFAFSNNKHPFCAGKQYFVYIMENLNVFTREVSMFRDFLMCFLSLFENFTSDETFRIESERLAGSIKSNFQIHHTSLYYLFLFFECMWKIITLLAIWD